MAISISLDFHLTNWRRRRKKVRFGLVIPSGNGRGKNKKTFTPQSFGLPESASELRLGQLFVNHKPISRQTLENLGFKSQNLAALIGE